jgi:hypothetical protein
VGKARPRAQQPLQLAAFLQLVDPSERGDHLLAHRDAFASALDDLQIGAAGGGLLAEIHGARSMARLIAGAHSIALNASGIKRNALRTWHYIFVKMLHRAHLNQ